MRPNKLPVFFDMVHYSRSAGSISATPRRQHSKPMVCAVPCIISKYESSSPYTVSDLTLNLSSQWTEFAVKIMPKLIFTFLRGLEREPRDI